MDETEQRYRELQQELAERKRVEEALAQEQHLLHTLLDNVPDAIYFKDAQSRFIRINKAHAERWFGLSDPAQAVGKTDFDYFTVEHAQPAYEDEQEVMRTGQTVVKEEKETWPDGRETWAATIKMPLRDKEGSIVGIFGVSRDITERKQAEEALRKAHEELEHYTTGLERRTAQLQVAAEVARDAAAILDVHQLLDETVHLVSARFGFYHAGAFLVDEAGEYAVLRAASSEGGRRMLARSHKLRIGQVGIVGHVAMTGEPRIALDVGADAVFFDNPDLPDTRSEMALPLKVRGRTIGVLDVQSTLEAAFSEDDVAVHQTLADQLAVAIENARLVERTEAQLRELSLLQGRYGASWSGLTSPRRQLGYVYDRVDVMPLVGQVANLSMALERGKTVAFVEPEIAQAVLATPLKLRDQIIGALGAQETDTAREWSPNEIALVEAVSEQVALALENARLFAEAQKAAQQTRALYETSRVLSSSLEREPLMHALLEAIYRALGGEYALISTVNEAARTIGVQHGIWHGEFDVFPEWIQMAQYSLDHPDILTDVYRTRRTEIISGWDTRFNREIWEKFGHERFLRIFMPIQMRERVLGIVEVGYDRHAKEHIGEEDVQMLTAFMDQAAVTLENARLFEEARTHAEELAALNELAQALTTRLSVEEVLDEVYRGASRLVDSANFYVALYDLDKDEVTFALDVSGGEMRRPHTTRQAGQGLTEYVIRTQQPLLIQENVAERLREIGVELIGQTSLSWLGVPLLVGGRVLGVMAVQSYTTPRAYDEHARELMTAIASQTAIALQNAHLFQEVRADATRRAFINEVLQAATSSLEPRELLGRAGETIARQLEMPSMILEWDPESETLQIVTAHDSAGADVPLPQPIVMTPEMQPTLFEAIHSRQLQTFSDKPATMQAVPDQVTQAFNLVGGTHIPLISRDQVLGLLVLGQQEGRSALDEGELAFVQIVAANVSVALENARLYQAAVRRARRERLAREITAKVVGSTDLDTILRTTVQELSKALGTSHALVRLGTQQRIEKETEAD
jgi:PAS domain S-box-containing protein